MCFDTNKNTLAMTTKLTLFAQIAQTLSRNSFKKTVNNFQPDKHSKGIDSWTHLFRTALNNDIF